jgi:hypothetical protein
VNFLLFLLLWLLLYCWWKLSWEVMKFQNKLIPFLRRQVSQSNKILKFLWVTWKTFCKFNLGFLSLTTLTPFHAKSLCTFSKLCLVVISLHNILWSSLSYRWPHRQTHQVLVMFLWSCNGKFFSCYLSLI